VKAARDLTQERLTVIEISGSDGNSYRHRDELKITQFTRAGGRGSEIRARTDSDLTGIFIIVHPIRPSSRPATKYPVKTTKPCCGS
jgi:hypothetical protein